jgi:hypothetical protein
MQKYLPRFLSSKASIIGVFASLILVLSIPLLVLISQQPQEQRSRASEISPPTQEPPPTGSRVVSGYIYHDTNKNGEREPGEQAFPGVTVRIKQIQDPGVVGSQDQIATTTDIKADNNGYFRYRFPATQNSAASYSIKVMLPDKYKTITTNPVIIADITKNFQQIIEFGLFPIDSLPGTETGISIYPTPIQSGQTVKPTRSNGVESGQQRTMQVQPMQTTIPQRTQQIPSVQGQ